VSTYKLEELEREIAGMSLPELLVRHRAGVAGGHAWRPLDAPRLTAGSAAWCGRCLRVRLTNFEGWLSVPD
jgi:hypothetical protein